MEKSAEEWEADIKRYAELRDDATRVRNWQDAAWWNSKRADAARAWIMARDRETKMKESGLVQCDARESVENGDIVQCQKYQGHCGNHVMHMLTGKLQNGRPYFLYLE
ncbi:MAG TPA: hypothetical protein VN039_12930 [Nitrospira sp.]|nr:hypothetical protein [Nitrospira sp.]